MFIIVELVVVVAGVVVVVAGVVVVVVVAGVGVVVVVVELPSITVVTCESVGYIPRLVLKSVDFATFDWLGFDFGC